LEAFPEIVDDPKWSEQFPEILEDPKINFLH
jgi:hypothetical protein